MYLRLTLLLSLAAFAGCSTHRQRFEPAAPETTLLAPGDIVVLHFQSQNSTLPNSLEEKINEHGDVTIIQRTPVHIAGLTLLEAGKRLTTAWRYAGMPAGHDNPEISVTRP